MCFSLVTKSVGRIIPIGKYGWAVGNFKTAVCKFKITATRSSWEDFIG